MPSRSTFTGLLVSIFLLSATVSAQWQSIGPVTSWKKTDAGLRLTASPGTLALEVVDSGIIRVRFSPGDRFKPDSSWAVLPYDSPGEFRIDETPDEISLMTPLLTVNIRKNPCRISVFDRHGRFLHGDDSTRGIGWSGHTVTDWKQIPAGERYYGFGEKSNRLEKSGSAMSMWNSDIPAYTENTDPLYQDIPFYYAIRDSVSYGIFLDNPTFTHFLIGKEAPDLSSFGVADGELNYYFIYGPTPADILRRYADLTGRMPMPPKWTLGYQQCRWSYYPEHRVREIASEFREKKIPCDAIYLDIHYMDGYRVFTWDSTRFPSPKKMISDLRRQGFNMVVIIDPGIKADSTYWVYRSGKKTDAYVKQTDGKEFIGKVWPGECAFPDFTRPEVRTWWGSLYRGLVDAGIRGFWNDMNEPSVFDGPNKTIPLTAVASDHGEPTDHASTHNVYGMQMVRATRDGILRLQPNERPFVLTRANYAGGQRYSAAWSGDNYASWENLRLGIRLCLGMSISGQPFIGTDIGGFIGMPTGELYARWLQFGVFSPLMRSHAEINSPNKEPWEYGPDFEAINRKTIELRYELLPYFYTSFQNAAMSGETMMKPLVFDYPSDPETFYCEDEFIFGREFLVAPVVESGQTERQLYLPAGTWYDYRSGAPISGGRSVTAKAPIDRIPLFVKAGSVIPTEPVQQYTGEKPPERITFTIFPDNGNAAGMLYEDDGISYGYEKGQFALRKVTLRKGTVADSLELSEQSGSYRPASRTLIFRIVNRDGEPETITRGNKTFPRVSDIGSNSRNEGWSYLASEKTVVLTIHDTFRREEFLLRR